jgi:hypothetical protein
MRYKVVQGPTARTTIEEPEVARAGLGDLVQTAVAGTEIVNAREGELHDFKDRAF